MESSIGLPLNLNGWLMENPQSISLVLSWLFHFFLDGLKFAQFLFRVFLVCLKLKEVKHCWGKKCLGPSMVGDVHAFLDSLPSVQFYEPDVDLIFKKIH